MYLSKSPWMIRERLNRGEWVASWSVVAELQLRKGIAPYSRTACIGSVGKPFNSHFAVFTPQLENGS